jgi:hypothetical protein
MLFFLTSQPLWLSALIVVAVPTTLAVLGPYVVRHYVNLEKLTTNNEIAGFKFATVGVLYAVLLAFAIILVWQKFSDAEALVAQEAGATETIFRLSSSLGEPSRKEQLRGALTAYVAVAVADDWPAMDRGEEEGSPSVRQALDELYTVLLAPPLPQGGDTILLPEILHQLDLITKARRAFGRRRGQRSRGRLDGPVRRSHVDSGFHLFLWNAKFAGADADDGTAVASDFFRVADHCHDRPPVFGSGQGRTAGAGRRA